MKKIKLELTEAQFLALVDLADTISAMKGCSDDENSFDKEQAKNLQLFDRMLKANGFSRKFK